MEEFDEQEKDPLSTGGMMNPMLHIILFTVTTFVNKYVLSVLKFTYPTIFQGWQTLVGALLLRLMIEFGRVRVDLKLITKSKLLPWLPAMFLYVLSIYSGSVALSNMAIPHFLCFQNCVHVFPALIELITLKQINYSRKYVPHHLILMSCLMLFLTDIEHGIKTYVWMAVHITSVGAIMFYEHLRCHAIQLSDFEKIYLNYVFSFLMLAPFSYFLGDAMSAQSFKFWYYYRFYVGCVLSGVCGAFLSLTSVRLKEINNAVLSWRLDVGGISRCASAILSVIFFSFNITPAVLIWVSINFTAAILLNTVRDSKQKGEEGQQVTAMMDCQTV